MSALPGLAACITQDGPDAACVQRQTDHLTPPQRQALAAFIAFTASHGERAGGDTHGDWPPGSAGLPKAGPE